MNDFVKNLVSWLLIGILLTGLIYLLQKWIGVGITKEITALLDVLAESRSNTFAASPISHNIYYAIIWY